ncbi:MAG: sugar phosphate nucleotidyltransferase [Acidimicrobiia bacterium]
MKAVILAGGEGTRLRPLTSNQPKPMIPIVNRPMMEHIVELLARHGFDDIVVTVAYLANQIRDYFGDGSDFGVRMRYATEESPLGTAGSVRNAAEELDDTFLVISGDVLTDLDLTAFVDAHRTHDAFASIALKRVENPLEFGIVITRPDGAIERFLEKPTWGEVFSDTINTGIYVCEPEVFDLIPEGEVIDFSGDVFPAALSQGRTLHGHVAEGYWEDVGTTEAYLHAHADVLDGKVELGIEGFRLGDGIWIGENAEVDPAARVEGPIVVGANCRIEAGARIGAYTVLGSDVVVRPDAVVERSICHDHVYIGRSVRMRGATVGRSTDIRTFALLEEGVVLGDECFIGEHAVVNTGVKVYPFKTVDDDAVVTSSIVWETKGARTLFGRRGIHGLANVDVTPEVAVRVAMAYATTLKRGSLVTTSRDTSRVARALKRAVIGGLNLAGVSVEDVELATVPLTRFQVRNGEARGGVTVRLAPNDPDSVEIRFFDADGRDIDEGTQRKIERLLAREEYRRAFAGEIGDIVFPPRTIAFYTAALEQSVDAERMRQHPSKVVLDYSSGAASIAMPSVLSKLGAEVLALNPYASTLVGAIDTEDQQDRIARIVGASASDLGCVINPGGETVTLVDDLGHVLTPTEMLLALVILVADTNEGARIAVPVNVSQSAEQLATDRGATIVWTKVADRALMEAASQPGISFAGSIDGGAIWPDFLPAYDATATLAHVLDLLAATGRKLSSVVAQLPTVHLAHDEVPTPWERKGAVMRELVERQSGRPMVLVDGVKVIRDDGWVLVLPDPERAFTHVWAEAGDAAAAAALVDEYATAIRDAEG